MGMGKRESAYRGIVERIAAASAERSGEVRLVAVSKRQPVEAIRALAGLGQRDFGENYLQEALDKQRELTDLPLTWHFIGPIQSNKTRAIAASFDWVHSVDRVKIAHRLGEQRDPSLSPLKVLIQVNVDGEESKSGADPADVPAIAAVCAEYPALELRGLMCIPRPGNTAAFDELAAINRSLAEPLPDLSMGMSGDFEAAIAAGATIVRVGTALFGPRDS